MSADNPTDSVRSSRSRERWHRTDLLEKYGYKAPPKTWEELAEMAKEIQDGERAAGKPDFQGFVFEGKASESVTCNAVEWIYRYGGGTVIDPDKNVTINNPNAIKALETAKSWVGTISPTNVTTYSEEEARNIWQVHLAGDTESDYWAMRPWSLE